MDQLFSELLFAEEDASHQQQAATMHCSAPNPVALSKQQDTTGQGNGILDPFLLEGKITCSSIVGKASVGRISNYTQLDCCR
jgi:hypothetical protein